MIVPVSPSGVPQRGLPGRLALLVFGLVVVSVVALATFGKGGDRTGPAPTGPSTARGPTDAPTPAPTPTRTPPPTPGIAVVACTVPAIGPLEGPPARHPAELVPTGIETVSATSGGESRLLFDRDGSLWAFGAGRLEHIGPSVDRPASWTFADDAGFGAWGIAAARDGGVWLFGGLTIRWFDGSRFRDVITAPVEVFDVLEVSDRSLWVSTSELGLLHWDGRAWSDLGGCAPVGSGGLLAEDPSGRIVIAYVGRGAAIGRFDGDTYWTFSTPFAPPRRVVTSVAVAPDGSVWVGREDGIAHFDGASWESFTTAEFLGTSAIAVATDGSVFAAIGDGAPLGSHVVRFDGASWTTVGWADAIAATAPSPARVSALAVAPDGALHAATSGGIARYRDGTWRLLTVRDGPLWPSDVVAVAGDEAWASGESGLWHLRDGRWTAVSLPGAGPDRFVVDLDLGGDGILWVAAVHQVVAIAPDGPIEVPLPGWPLALAARADGSAWVVGQDGELRLVRLVDGAPVVETLARPPIAGIQRLAAAPDGALWVAAPDGGGGPGASGLARFDGRRWEIVRPLGDEAAGATVVAVAPEGTVWAALAPDGSSGRGPFATFDGRGWALLGPESAPGTWIGGIAFGRDGSVWAAGDRLYRFDGRSWSSSPAGSWFGPPSIAPDGTIFLLGPSGIQRFTGWPFD